ncbi:MAG TPA: hypothetical protein VNA65_05030, partial [Candidatus Dormibacteraeota bacterium]|nr:hypothetical protein [Candidatus Dormibacteraeota bacterium]
DVVPIVPLGSATLHEAHVLARAAGERIWTELHIPVYFYGHGEAHTLAAIRAGRAAPDFGGPALHSTAGAICIGARAALVAFNVILSEAELTEARDLARSLRESSGGLRGVQALAFRLANGQVQLSMNLFRLSDTHPADVLAELARRGVSIVSQEIVGLCPAAAANAAAAGRLLEAALASAAARAAANRCRAIGDDEHVALAGRLDREAGELARLDATQDSFLAGAERAAALIQVLRAAQVFNPELEAMLDAAARGFRFAVNTETAAVFAARISALDARLR